LRSTLTAANASEEEFKALYRAQAAFDEKFGTALGAMPPEQRAARQAAQAETEEQFKAALGEARYAEFARAADNQYQQVSNMVKQAGMPAAVATAIIDERDSVLNESNRIFDDPSLSNDQKRAAIQTLAQNARTQALSTLGEDVGQKYLQVANGWLGMLDRGQAVKMTSSIANGSGISSSRSLPESRPTALPATTAPR
jgi:hypothetical protein